MKIYLVFESPEGIPALIGVYTDPTLAKIDRESLPWQDDDRYIEVWDPSKGKFGKIGVLE